MKLTEKASIELFKKRVLILEINYEVASLTMSVEQKSYRGSLLDILNVFFPKDERKSDLIEFSESMLEAIFEKKKSALKEEQKKKHESIIESFLPDSYKPPRQKRRKK